MLKFSRALLVLGAITAATTAHAQTGPEGPGGGLSPLVPVSAFARPDAWLDRSRLQVVSEISFGTGFGGTSQGLQVTRFQYQFSQPLAVAVSVGNSFGGPNARGTSPFLEGLDLSYQPFKSFLIQVHYQDVRSPLQYSRGPFSTAWR